MAHPPRWWFDAHLDLAALACGGRDMLCPDPTRAGGPWQPGAVTLPSLARGKVTACLATIFTERVTDGSPPDPGVGYAAPKDPALDTDEHVQAAHAAALQQLAVYQRWSQAGHATLVTPHRPLQSPRTAAPGAQPSLYILMECSDPVRSPAELAWWRDQGVVAIGLTWARGSRAAGGNATLDSKPQPGLSSFGRELVREMDRLNLIHDQSHLSDAATDDLFAATNRPVIASHSNCRAITDPAGTNHRHLSDATIREIARRGGVIGLNLFSLFLIPRSPRDQRATVDQALAHVEHICSLVGHTRAVALGSDMDGGLSASALPQGINEPSDLTLLIEALARRGWGDSDLANFTHANLSRIFRS